VTRTYHTLLVSSSGGVLLDLLALEPWWAQHSPSWAVVRAPDTETALAGYRTYWMKEIRFERPLGVIGGVIQALKLLQEVRPDVIVSAGSGVAIGFFIAARIRRIPCFWLETFNMIDRSGLSAGICSRLASVVLVQRTSMLKAHPNAVMLGELY